MIDLLVHFCIYFGAILLSALLANILLKLKTIADLSKRIKYREELIQELLIENKELKK